VPLIYYTDATAPSNGLTTTMTTTTRASDTYKHTNYNDDNNNNNNNDIIYDSSIGRGREREREREAKSTDRAAVSLVVGACISVRLLQSQKVEPLMRSVFYKPSAGAFIYINYNIINNIIWQNEIIVVILQHHSETMDCCGTRLRRCSCCYRYYI